MLQPKIYSSKMKMQQDASERLVYTREARTKATSNDAASSFPMSICVVGSSNFDLIAYAKRLPKKGETVLGNDFKMGFGGKGANQAVASAKLGAHVTMVTKLGNDPFGIQTLENYKSLNINTDYVFITDKAPSGVAPIWVDKNANNSIIVIPGANNLLDLEDIQAARCAIASSQILICQNEIPFHITQRALQIGKEEGVTTFFNPAPAPTHKMSRKFFKLIDIICSNETEAELLTKRSVKNVKDAIQAGEYLIHKGARKAIITLGAKGCVLVTKDFARHIPIGNEVAAKVKAIDTTGAGDCFIGSLVYFYANGCDDHDAICKAQYVAARSVQKFGTQSSYPSINELPIELFKR